MFLRNISTSVQMILRCLGKERDAADEPTWKDHGRDGQERTWVIVKITITKNPILLLTRMDVRLLAMMSLEIRAEAVEPAGGCVWHVGHTRPAHKVPPRTNRQIQSAKITQIFLFYQQQQGTQSINLLFIATQSDFLLDEFWQAAVRGLFDKICLKKKRANSAFLLVYLHKHRLFPCRQGPRLALKMSGAPPNQLPSESGSGNLTSSLVTNIRNAN